MLGFRVQGVGVEALSPTPYSQIAQDRPGLNIRGASCLNGAVNTKHWGIPGPARLFSSPGMRNTAGHTSLGSICIGGASLSVVCSPSRGRASCFFAGMLKEWHGSSLSHLPPPTTPHTPHKARYSEATGLSQIRYYCNHSIYSPLQTNNISHKYVLTAADGEALKPLCSHQTC